MGILDSGEPGCREALTEIADVIGVAAKRIQSWAMVNRAGAEHAGHTHAGVDLSGVYYLDDDGTPTLFGRGVELAVSPRIGRLAVFSGALWHRVPTVVTDSERVTVAFNVLG